MRRGHTVCPTYSMPTKGHPVNMHGAKTEPIMSIDIARSTVIVALLCCTFTHNAVLVAGRLEFIEEPQSQSILMGESAKFYCKAFATTADWKVDDRVLQYPYLWGENAPQDIALDKSADRTYSTDTYNMSMTINGTVNRNYTRVSCLITGTIGGNTQTKTSSNAILYVYYPQPPILTFDFSDWPSTVTIHIETPQMFNYSFFNFVVTSRMQEQPSFNTSIPATTPFLTIPANATLIFGTCLQYFVNATSVSYSQDESPAREYLFVSPVPGPTILLFENASAVNSTVYFDANLHPTVFFQAQVTQSCDLLLYTYIIFISNNTSSIEVGPRKLPNNGFIREEVTNGLLIDTMYTFRIEVQSLHPTTQEIQKTALPEVAFSTHFNSRTVNPCLVPIQEGQFQLISVALGILCGLLLLTLLVFIVICCLAKKTRRRKEEQSSDVMITNPIYSGPVYETVPQGYNPLSTNSSTCTTPDSPSSSPTAPLNGTNRYDLNPTSRTDIVDLVRRNTLPNQPNSRVVSPLTGISYRSSSLSGNPTPRPPREMNKLHLRLSLKKSNEGSSEGTPSGNVGGSLEGDDYYTVMSPAISNRGFGSSLNGGWGYSSQSSPEQTRKYQE